MRQQQELAAAVSPHSSRWLSLRLRGCGTRAPARTRLEVGAGPPFLAPLPARRPFWEGTCSVLQPGAPEWACLSGLNAGLMGQVWGLSVCISNSLPGEAYAQSPPHGFRTPGLCVLPRCCLQAGVTYRRHLGTSTRLPRALRPTPSPRPLTFRRSWEQLIFLLPVVSPHRGPVLALRLPCGPCSATCALTVELARAPRGGSALLGGN